MAHTPGPWQIEGKYQGDAGSLYLSTMHPMPIFELQPIVGTEDEHIANATLIAAAPDLLEALSELRLYISDIPSAKSDRFTLINQRALAAIAKANGVAS